MAHPSDRAPSFSQLQRRNRGNNTTRIARNYFFVSIDLAISPLDDTRLSECSIEIRGCASQDKRPYYPIPRTWLDRFSASSRASNYFKVPQKYAEQWNLLCPDAKASFASYESLYRLSAQTQDKSERTKGQMWVFDEYCGGWTTVLVHTLLSRYGTDKCDESYSLTQEAIRLASLLYLGVVWRRYGVSPVRSCRIAEKLLAIHGVEKLEWEDCWAIKAWTLVMGAIETGKSTRASFLEKLVELAWEKSLPLKNLVEGAKKVLWLEDVFPTTEELLKGEMMNWAMKKCPVENPSQLMWNATTYQKAHGNRLTEITEDEAVTM